MTKRSRQLSKLVALNLTLGHKLSAYKLTEQGCAVAESHNVRVRHEAPRRRDAPFGARRVRRPNLVHTMLGVPNNYSACCWNSMVDRTDRGAAQRAVQRFAHAGLGRLPWKLPRGRRRSLARDKVLSRGISRLIQCPGAASYARLYLDPPLLRHNAVAPGQIVRQHLGSAVARRETDISLLWRSELLVDASRVRPTSVLHQDTTIIRSKPPQMQPPAK